MPPTGDRLDEICTRCDRPIGEHTIRQLWTECRPPGFSIPFEHPADGPFLLPELGLPPDMIVADHVNTRALLLDTPVGPLGVLETTWYSATPQGPGPTTRIGFIGERKIMREIGILLRDSAYGVANAITNHARKPR